MIRSFKDKLTVALFEGARPSRFPADLVGRARQRLTQLHAARRLNDLRVPAGNRLEALAGDRRGSYSVRINGQWRICFRWLDGDAHDVEVVDYH